MKLESWHDAKEKARYKIVRLDTFSVVPGEIVSADEGTGTAVLTHGGETKTHEFGSQGIRIIAARR